MAICNALVPSTRARSYLNNQSEFFFVLAKEVLAKEVLAKEVLAKEVLAKEVLTKEVLAKEKKLTCKKKILTLSCKEW